MLEVTMRQRVQMRCPTLMRVIDCDECLWMSKVVVLVVHIRIICWAHNMLLFKASAEFDTI